MKSSTCKYRTLLLVLILTTVFSASAQVSSNGNQSGNSFLGNSKPKLNMSLSSSFSSYGNGLTVIGTSVLPQITFPISDKFSLKAGIGYSTLFFGGDNQSMYSSAPTSYGHLFVSGDYIVNEKITLRGTAYKTFSLGSNPMVAGENESVINDFSSQGFIMDIEYKVTENFRVNVGVEYRQQNYPFYQPGMMQSNQFNGFGNNSGNFQHQSGLNPF
jgi:hypothetical protein